MPEDLETILRKSLDEVDRDRKRWKRTSAIMFVPFFAAILAQGYISLKTDVKFLVIYSVALLFLAELGLAIQTWITVASATRKILEAIELLTKQ